MRIGLILLILSALGGVAAAEPAASPAGRWRTIDDETHRPKSIVRLWERDGVLYGNIVEVFPEPGKPADPICDKCEGALKDKPVKGMMFMWGLKRDGKDWSGGRILDPANGKIYRCTVRVVSGGARLKVRGYIGVSLIGRTQTWEWVGPDVAPPST
jgi:uncharacterized protein (DUF2147 family)